ncbi:MAG: OmpA family protein, partial [Minwuiales bacterium]|nr:OmpA family protein [Minwuiales bacterium]
APAVQPAPQPPVQQAPAQTAFAAPQPQAAQNPFRQSAVAAPPANPSAILASPGRLVAIIMFRSGSSNLSAKDRAAVKQVADYVTSYGGALRVVGHASSRTREVSVAKHKLINFNVSLGRAESVARELMRQGVPSQAILVEARGDSEPRYIEAMPSGEAQNRRAEIYLIN